MQIFSINRLYIRRGHFFECKTCGKYLSCKDRLKYHTMIHTGEKPYKCEVCNKSFRRLSSLDYHKRTHTGEKPYKCKVCDKSFTQAHNLKKHELIHTRQRAPKTYRPRISSSNRLNPYIGTYTGEKPYKCHTCSMEFKNSFGLKMHQRTHRIAPLSLF